MLPVVSFHYNYKNQFDTINLGDYIQTLAVEAFYDRYFPDAERISLDRDELASYNGKPALVVMQGWFSLPGNLDFIPSPDLVPVFAGTHFSYLTRDELTSSSCDFFERFGKQAIGCRDYSTMYYLRAAGGNAYFSRCLTLTFPRRTECPEKQKKIFWVDVPERLQSLLPPVFRQNVEIIEQRKLKYQAGNESFYRQQADDLLKKYREEACCVVTTAIHCAMPCAGMGIPVVYLNIVDRNTVIERWSALHGIIPVFTENDLKNGTVPDRIPEPPEFEELKECILKNVYFSCLQALGQDCDPAEVEAVRKYIAEFNRTGSAPFESIRTLDAAKTLQDLWEQEEILWKQEEILSGIKNSWSYRIGLWISWLPRKISRLFCSVKKNG